jgi:hypothetical protein
MKLLIGEDGYDYSTLIECSENIQKHIYEFYDQFIHSESYCPDWGADDFVMFIQSKLTDNSKDYIRILDLYSNKYNNKYPKICL